MKTGSSLISLPDLVPPFLKIMGKFLYYVLVWGIKATISSIQNTYSATELHPQLNNFYFFSLVDLGNFCFALFFTMNELFNFI